MRPVHGGTLRSNPDPARLTGSHSTTLSASLLIPKLIKKFVFRSVQVCSLVVDKQCLGNENGNNGNHLKHSRVTINVMVITSMGIVTTLTPQKRLWFKHPP